MNLTAGMFCPRSAAIEPYVSLPVAQGGAALTPALQDWPHPVMNLPQHLWLTDRDAASDALQNFFLDRYAAAYRAEIDHFAMVLAGEQAPSVTFADGLAALELAEAAALSAQTGQPVRL